jgi:hypothetical protein
MTLDNSRKHGEALSKIPEPNIKEARSRLVSVLEFTARVQIKLKKFVEILLQNDPKNTEIPDLQVQSKAINDAVLEFDAKKIAHETDVGMVTAYTNKLLTLTSEGANKLGMRNHSFADGGKVVPLRRENTGE